VKALTAYADWLGRRALIRTVLSRHNLHRTYQGAVAKLADPAVPLRPTARRVLQAFATAAPNAWSSSPLG
jgi:hypothetical protein